MADQAARFLKELWQRVHNQELDKNQIMINLLKEDKFKAELQNALTNEFGRAKEAQEIGAGSWTKILGWMGFGNPNNTPVKGGK